MKVRGVIIKGLVDITCLGVHLPLQYTRKPIPIAGASIYLQDIARKFLNFKIIEKNKLMHTVK